MLSQDTDKKLFLLDAYALIFRAYYAFIRNPRINSKGLNTSAMFGFTNVVLDIVNNEKPTHIAVVFDPPGGTFRSEQYESYKANRDETPEDIKLSVPFIKDILKGFGIPIMVKEGFEADDVIGTVAKQAEKDGYLTYMMTSDKDMGQLISENILMYRPGRSGKPAEIWGIAEINERYGLERPEQVIDILGMMGDSADNIPGIPGVGEKTAIKLLGKYGSMENLLANTHELKGKQKENVENHKEQALLSKQLATIITDIDMEIDYEDMKMSEMDRDHLKKIFEELEFRTLARRVLGEELPNAGEQISLFGGADEASAEADIPEVETTPLKTLESTTHDYKLVMPEDADELIDILKKADTFCFDTETTGLDSLLADIVGMSFSVKPGQAWYVGLVGTEDEKKAAIEAFRPIFEDESKTMVAQNLKYDYKVMHKYGIEIKNKLWDTMIAHYLMNADMKHGMDFLAETYLNYKPVSIETLIGKKGKNQGNMGDLSPEQITDYACEDADITLQLKEKFQEEVEQVHLKSLFEDVEVPLLKVLADMEMEGVNLDVQTLKDYSQQLAGEIEGLEKEIHELAGETFNVDSPKQLGPILFEKLGIGKNVRKTKSGQYSTSEDILTKFKADHPIMEKILDYRQARKLKSTYVDPLPELVNPNTGRVHTHYMQTVAATGRLSSNNPNLQNIPIRTERGRYIRKAFIPRDEHHILLAADYSQVELRIIAALSGDEGMIKAFQEGQDIHAATAAKVFGVSLENVDREMRSKAKAVNFGIIYGQGAFGLAQNLGIKRGEAKEIIENYYTQFARLREYQTENIEFARKNGYVETILGRRRYLKDINSKNAVVRGFAERNAINAPIQGSAADIIKLAMLKIQEVFQKEQFKSRMIMQVHDELVFDAHLDELDVIKPIIVEGMQDAYKMVVPLKVDMDTGENWLQAH
ncbi:DNA polymerase I [Sanyastnella coralliicola]|uniref:DNA polymerase I n=1 Tax=Sanyastnella coralliicola TaxID=3069118 RepID=UPI0027B9426C|nr:DNA polymerase I [Longitalea sp. SCSIO 12813]